MIQDYEVRKVEVSKVKLDKANPNQMTDKQLESLRYALKKFGGLQPIIVDDQYNMIDGEHRWRAYHMEGEETIPAIVIPNVTDSVKRLIRQTMNKLHGEHRADMDAEEYRAILEAGEGEELKKLLQLSITDVERHIRDMTPAEEKEEDFDVPEAKGSGAKYKVERGDVWQLGDHRLMCGDSTNKEDVSKLMNGEQADMVFTDPPYAIYGSSTGISSNVADDKMVRSFFRDLLQACQDNTKPFAHIYVCNDWRSYPSWFDQARVVKLAPKNLIVWRKNNVGMGAMYMPHYELLFFLSNVPEQKLMTVKKTGERSIPWGKGNTNVWEFDIVPGGTREHNAQKPVPLIEKALKNSTDEGQSVIDWCGGSGSTLIAAEKTGRKCFMMEMDSAYCSVIIERWENFTGKKAVKL